MYKHTFLYNHKRWWCQVVNGHRHWTEEKTWNAKCQVIFDDKMFENEHIFFLMKESRIVDAVFSYYLPHRALLHTIQIEKITIIYYYRHKWRRRRNKIKLNVKRICIRYLDAHCASPTAQPHHCRILIHIFIALTRVLRPSSISHSIQWTRFFFDLPNGYNDIEHMQPDYSVLSLMMLILNGIYSFLLILCMLCTYLTFSCFEWNSIHNLWNVNRWKFEIFRFE